MSVHIAREGLEMPHQVDPPAQGGVPYCNSRPHVLCRRVHAEGTTGAWAIKVGCAGLQLGEENGALEERP